MVVTSIAYRGIRVSTAFVPQQPQHPGGTQDGPPPVPPYASEASRLLCAGTYLDPGYRDRVIEQLYLHEQRFVAPSLGFDAARVLAHALRARRLEMLWSAAVVGLWIVGTLISGNLLLYFVWPSVMLAVAPLLRGRDARPPWYRSLIAFLARWGGRVLTVFAFSTLFSVALGEGGEGSSYSSYSSSSSYGYSGDDDVLGALTGDLSGNAEPWQAWFGIGVLVVIGLCVAGRRTQFARVLSAELSPARFPDAAATPPSGTTERGCGGCRSGSGWSSTRRSSCTTRRARSAGRSAHDTWVLAVELRPDEDADQQPLSNRAILDRVRPSSSSCGCRPSTRAPAYGTGYGGWRSTSACSCPSRGCCAATRRRTGLPTSTSTGRGPSRRAARSAGTSCASASPAGRRSWSSPSSSASTPRAGC